MQETLTTSKKDTDKHRLAALKTLLICTVRKDVRSTEFMSWVLETVINNSEFMAVVAALVKSE